MTDTTLQTWTDLEFQGLNLGDARWLARLEAMVERASERPAGCVSAVYPTDAERQGAYGLLGNDQIDSADLVAAMSRTTVARSSGDPFVYVAIDGSSLTLTDRRAAKGFGVVGTYQAKARGIKVMSALAVSSDGTPLGLCFQQHWCRANEKVAIPHDKRKTEDKETRYWLHAIEGVYQCFAENHSKTVPWLQLDQEGDAWPVLLAGLQPGRLITVRGRTSRVVTTDDGRKLPLTMFLKERPALGTYHLEVRARPNRTARTATIEVHATQTTLDLRDKFTGKAYKATVWAVLATEISKPPKGEKPIEWLLLTNRNVPSFAEAMEVVQGYTQRWRIEEFHRLWKSGACHVEDTQLRSREAVIKWATILAVSATRLLRLTYLGRNRPDQPALVELSPYEITAIHVLRRHNPVTSRQVFTIGQAVQCLAELGGYTGRSSGGPPGATVLARGLERVQALAAGVAILLEFRLGLPLSTYD